MSAVVGGSHAAGGTVALAEGAPPSATTALGSTMPRPEYYADTAASDVERGEGMGVEGGQQQLLQQEQQQMQERQQSRQEDVEQEQASHVGVAATEAHEDGERNRRGAAQYRCMAETCNVMLLGLVVGFAGIFTYAWVDALRKAKYDHAIGLITILFFGTVVCACGYRRRLAAIGQLEEDRVQMQIDQIDFIEQWIQPPKGVPLHVRQHFDYYIFSAPVDAKAGGSEADTDKPAPTPPVPSAPDGPPGQTTPGGGSPKTSGVDSETTATDLPAVEEDKAEGSAVSGAGSQRQRQHQHPPPPQHQGLFAWASSTLTDCSVCLEAYRGGDRVCRLPCAHTFHAACIDTWLDQQHVCPQCRLDLLPPDLSWGRSSMSSTANPPPFSAIFGPSDRRIPVPRPTGVAATRASNSSPESATASAPYASFLNSPAYGASPPSGVNGMRHFRRSPDVFRSGNRHRSVSINSNSAGSPAAGLRPYHPSHVLSPAYTPSPQSTSSHLRWSPRFVTTGTRSRGTPVPAGIGRFGMFPPFVQPSASFSALDATPLPRAANGTAGTGNGGARRHLPPTPSRVRIIPIIQPSPNRPAGASQHDQRQHPRARQVAGRGQSQQPEDNPLVQTQVVRTIGPATAGAPSPPPLPRLTPARPQPRGAPRGGRPSTPIAGGSDGFSAGGTAGGGGASNGSGGATNGSSSNSTAGAGAPRGSLRARGGSSGKRLRLPNLNRRPRSSSCDVAGSASPPLFVLGNASTKAGGGAGREFDWAGGSIWTSNKGLSTARPRVRLASWEGNGEDVSHITTRCRPGSEDWGSSGSGSLELAGREAFERAFMSGSSATTDQHASHTGIPNAASAGLIQGSRQPPQPQPQQQQQQQVEAHQVEPQQGGQPHQPQPQPQSQPERQPPEQVPPRDVPVEQRDTPVVEGGGEEPEEEEQDSEDPEGESEGPRVNELGPEEAPHYNLSFDDETSEESESEDGDDESGSSESEGEYEDEISEVEEEHEEEYEDEDEDEDEEESEMEDTEMAVGSSRGPGRFWQVFSCQ